MSTEPVMSLGAATYAATQFRKLFVGSYLRWETAGWVRRKRHTGKLSLAHVIVPGPPKGLGTNAVWERALQLLAESVLTPAAPNVENLPWLPEPETTACRLVIPPWTHELLLATPDNFGVRIAEHTGPKGYWRMLMHRLELAGTLKLQHGCACAIDRSGPTPRTVAIPCREEKEFFRLARTRYRQPGDRWDRPAGDNRRDWERGVEPEWYPAGVRPYVDPARAVSLFDTSRPVEEHFIPDRDWRRWQHT